MKKEFYKQYGVNSRTKCASCGEKVSTLAKNKWALEEGRYSEKKSGWVCGGCVESDNSYPRGTVVIYKPNEQTIEKWTIKDYADEVQIENNVSADNLEIRDPESCPEEIGEDCPIQFAWHSTDAWRGYNEAVTTEWVQVHDDCILSGSEDASELKSFDADLKRFLWEQGFEFAVVFGSTSNLFSCGYDVYVKKTDQSNILKTVLLFTKLRQLASQFRDPTRFITTAITGKTHVGDFDDKDMLLVEAAQRLKNGEDPEKVQEDILLRAT